MTNKFDAQKNDDRAPKERNNNRHGFNLWNGKAIIPRV